MERFDPARATAGQAHGERHEASQIAPQQSRVPIEGRESALEQAGAGQGALHGSRDKVAGVSPLLGHGMLTARSVASMGSGQTICSPSPSRDVMRPMASAEWRRLMIGGANFAPNRRSPSGKCSTPILVEMWLDRAGAGQVPTGPDHSGESPLAEPRQELAGQFAACSGARSLRRFSGSPSCACRRVCRRTLLRPTSY